jgi:hypothetical protein
MKFRPFVIVACLLSLAGPPVFARSGSAAGGASSAAFVLMSRARRNRELRDFRDFLGQNPTTAAALKRDPKVVLDGGFRAANPPLTQYLAAHRPFAKRFEKRPVAVMAQLERLKH